MSKIQKTFYPYCKENNCRGILKITINDNFSIDYVCSKNPEHKKQNIYFKTFERFYLQQKEISKCCRCNETSIKYKCQDCSKIYCSSCLKEDIHFKQKMFIKKICKFCKKNHQNLTQYCTECENKFNNLYLIINKNIEQKKYKFENIAEYIPSKDKIDSILNKLNTYEILIDIINAWQKTLMEKIEHLKENILNEKALLNKMILNFDKNFLDYTYYSNINYLYKYKNEIYSNLINKNTFEKKTNYLMKYLNVDMAEKKTNTFSDIVKIYLNLTQCDSIKHGLIKKINDDYYFNCFGNNISLITFDINQKSLIELASLNCGKEANIFSFSNDKDDKNIYYLYYCLKRKKVVLFFKVDIKDCIIEKMEEKIKEEEKGYFNHCIYIGKKKLATVDKWGKSIKIWKKKKNKYSKINKINISKEIDDLLFVNNECLVVSTFGNKIFFIDNNDFNIEKKLYIDDYENLTDFNKYIFYRCNKGIGLIYIKTKEVVQIIKGDFCKIFFDDKAFYTFDTEKYNEQRTHTFHGSYTYAYDYKITMLKYEFMNDEIFQETKYKYIDKDHIEKEKEDRYDHEHATDDFSGDYDLKMIIIKNRMIFWNEENDNIYISSELSA